jgi:hypothetical protein
MPLNRRWHNLCFRVIQEAEATGQLVVDRLRIDCGFLPRYSALCNFGKLRVNTLFSRHAGLWPNNNLFDSKQKEGVLCV